jgi:replicative DNA helicase
MERSQRYNTATDYHAEITGKLAPQAKDLEEAVLGALMIDSDAITAVGDILTPQCFYQPQHREIYGAIQSLFAVGTPVDILTVSERLRKAGSSVKSYELADLTNRVASAANVEYHARIIAQKYLRRRVIEVSTEAIRTAYDDSTDDFAVLEQAEKGLFSVWQGINSQGGQTLHSASKTAFKMAELATQSKGLTGIPSGLTTIDRLTGGWQPTDLIILAARPGMGKTAFAVQMGFNAAKDFKIPVALFSLEMSSAQLAMRVMSEQSSIDSHKLRQGKTSPEELMKLAQVADDMAAVPFYIDETPGLSIFQLRAAARRMVMRHGIKLIIVDYLQLMSGSGEKGKNRDQEIGEITKGLKQMAKEMQVPVICLSQLSRAVEQRGGSKRPQLSDLRESGNVEQDADIVSFLYRPEYYGIMEDENAASLAGVCEVIFAKHRNGALGTEKVKFEATFTRFSDIDSFNASTQFPNQTQPGPATSPVPRGGYDAPF